LRIAYYFRLLSRADGPGVHARALVRAWRALDHQVLCLPTEPDATKRAAPRKSIGANLPVALRERASLLRAALRLSRETGPARGSLTSFKPDLLVARREFNDWVLDHIIDGLDHPYVAEVNAVSWVERRDMLGLSTTRAEMLREKQYLLGAARCACVSHVWADQLRELGIPENRIVVTPNGVDTNLFAPSPRETRGESSTPRDWTPLFGFVGTGVATHDLVSMGKAATVLLSRVPSAGFLFVGLSRSDLSAAGFAAEVLERAHATGPVAHEGVPQWLARCDVLWAAFNHSHGSPLKIAEYMAMAKPVVAACAGQAEESIAAAECGCTVAIGDWESLAAQLCRIAQSDCAHTEALGRHGRAWVMRHGAWESVAAAMIRGVT
jgi:glycosyltransferase involved in cell wall biosynthesis